MAVLLAKADRQHLIEFAAADLGETESKMAMNQSVNKTHAVLDYLKAHPAATSNGIIAALRKQGILISFDQAARIRMTTDAALNSAAPQENLTLEQIKMIAQAIKRIRSRRLPFGTA